MLRNVARVIVLLAAVSGAAHALISFTTVSGCGGPNRYDRGPGVAEHGGAAGCSQGGNDEGST
jgi:hypothetical protein